jgi:hypothetical protein
MLQRLKKALQSPRGPIWLGLLALALCLPSLRQGLQADDVLFSWKLERGAPPWRLFSMDAASIPEAREAGYLVWWSSPQLARGAAFLRPLASLSHWLDFSLWPRAAWLMHLQNALLYAAAVALAAQLYRRFAGSLAVAGLAGLLFALDDGHAYSAGWISGRNTLLALLFALLALELHVRARASTQRSALLALASTLSVGLGLASAEAGLWALGFLLGYALTLETGSLLARLRSIGGPLVVGAIWAVIYVALGCGFRGTSFYRDPSAPFSALLQGALDLPLWLDDLFGPVGFPVALLYPTAWARLAALPFALLLLWLLWPARKDARAARFFALTTCLGLVPVMFTIPTSRVLLGASFGAMGLIACAIEQSRSTGTARGRFRADALLTMHVALAGLSFIPASAGTQSFAYGTASIVEQVQPGRDVILLREPVELLDNYVLLTLNQGAHKARAPRSVHALYSGASELWIERMDANTLEIEATQGWGNVPIERIFCAPEDMPRAGREVQLGAFRARVLRSNQAGMPERVRFVFPSALEAPERQWLIWEGNRPVPFSPPPVGRRVRSAPLSFFSALRP